MESDGTRVSAEQVEQCLQDAYNTLSTKMGSQLLADEKLGDSWLSVVKNISSRVAQKVDANCLRDAFEMDVRRLVKVKTIVGGSKADSNIIKGLVFSKNVVHRRMRQNISNPRILLLSCPVVYEQQSLTSLDVVMRFETSYLQNIVARIASLSPDILVVEQSVARTAQEMLLDCKITLVTNVKSSLMERLSIFTGADIVYSLDFQEKPKLGRCDNFYLQTFHSKTLMYFDGCPQHSGCTVILRGSVSKQELKKIKQICSFMIFCDYNWRLEKSFLMDVCAVPKSMFTLENSCDNRRCVSNDLSEKTSGLLDEEINSCERKVEPVAIEDNSDPLRSMAEEANTSFTNTIPCHSNKDEQIAVEQTEISMSHLIKKAILSSSPFIDVKMPYLLTAESDNCSLKQYINTGNLYWTKRYSLLNISAIENSRLTVDDATTMKDELFNLSDYHFKREHPFYSRQLTQRVSNSAEVQSLLADFRARGGVLSYKQSLNENELSRSSDETREPFCDALHPKFHQRIPILYCSYSYSSQNPFCVSPAIVEMEFYGACDISLGGFLEKYCFFHAYSCPVSGCNIAMTEHTRKFIHDSGSVQISLKQLKNSIEAAENNIITWSWCQYCKSSTRHTILSPDSWCLSFGKYLELIINGSKYVRRCSQGAPACLHHSLFNDNVQYFAFKQMVASFNFCPIVVREIEMPPPKIHLSVETLSVSALTDELKSITIKGYDVLSSILGTVCTLKEESSTPKHEAILSEFLACETSDRMLFRSKIDENHIELANNPDLSQRLAIADNLILLQKYIADVVSVWNLKFQDFASNKKKDEKILKSNSQQRQISSSDVDQISSTTTSTTAQLQMSDEAEEAIERNVETTSSDVNCSSYEEQQSSDVFSGPSENSQTCYVDCNSLKACMYAQQEECHSKLEELDKIVDENPIEADLEKFVSSDSSVSSVAYGVAPGISALLSKDAMLSGDDESYAVYHMNTASVTETVEEQRKVEETASVSSLSTVNEQNRSLTSNATERENFKQTTVKTIINQLLSSSSNLLIESPFEPSEHFLQSIKEKLPVIVRDNDPGSIVAFCLASSEYEKMLNDLLRSTVSPNTKKKLPVENILSDSKEFEGSLPSNTKISVSNTQDLHIDLQFSDASSKFHCCVYFAEQFRRLRSETLDVNQNFSTNNSNSTSVGNSVEAMFIRAISKTIPWKARGGKSSSNFFKTINDRFILKEMSTAELQSFLSIAKHYFEYIANATLDRRPTLLAKIVGVYKISSKNSLTNSATKMYVLVLENIFYLRDITQKFDLKGSVRNRLASTNTPDEVVLLDENLIKMTRETPFYVRHHTKKILQLTIANDSLFLSNLSLMDYSLLVGIDEQRKEFVVGIIDYIRNFTWDKKLEMMVKSVGSHGKTPTIVSPDVYRERFREKMDQYFLDVPDKWYKLETNDHCFTFSPFNS